MKRYDNKSLLIFGCLHAPYHHPDSLEFLSALKTEYKPDRVLCLGDEVDNNAISFHPSDPDLFAAGAELKASKKVLKSLEKLFPKVDIVKSNHGSLIHRRVVSAGLPAGLIKSYNKIYGVGSDWKWHLDLTLTTSDKNQWYFCHGKSSKSITLSKSLGLSVAQAHYHNSRSVEPWTNMNNKEIYGCHTGCLIDDTSLAYNYNKSNVFRPVLGALVILDGVPTSIPLRMKKSGRWLGRL